MPETKLGFGEAPITATERGRIMRERVNSRARLHCHRCLLVIDYTRHSPLATRLEVGAAERLGDHRRPLLALDLDRLLVRRLVDVRLDLVDAEQFGAQPNPLADVDRRDEADSVQTVVEAHLRAQLDGDPIPRPL